jgi:CRISPR type IV-associated protein Csf3
MAAENYRPLKITFRLTSPLCLTYPFIHFDSILAHLIARKEMGDDHRSRPSKEISRETMLVGEEKHMPLKQSSGVYHASVSIFDVADAQTTTIYKRFCQQYLDFTKLKRTKIHTNMGFFRDFMLRLVYIPASTVTFFACGDKEKIAELLDGLGGIGKKTAIGFGMIKDYLIEEIDQDCSVVKNGRSMRAIPIILCDTFGEVVNLAWRAPYWAKEMVAPCVPPDSTCILSQRFHQKDFKTRKYLVENRMMLEIR